MLSKLMLYTSLLMLAYGCIQTANNMNKNFCACERHGMALVIVGCTTFTLALFYDLKQAFLLISLVPLISGIALWLIVSDADAHNKFDKIATDLKVRAAMALELIKNL